MERPKERLAKALAPEFGNLPLGLDIDHERFELFGARGVLRIEAIGIDA
jgi:hypothetical protein